MKIFIISKESIEKRCILQDQRKVLNGFDWLVFIQTLSSKSFTLKEFINENL